MNKNSISKPVAAAIGAVMVGGLTMANMAVASDNPFGLQPLDSGYMRLAAEGKCGGEKKEAEGKCGGEKKEAAAKCGGEKKEAAGKCGGEKKEAAGKCGGEKKEAGKCGGAK